MKHWYHVAYLFPGGHGDSQISLSDKIEGPESISLLKLVKHTIKKNSYITQGHVVIINYIYLGCFEEHYEETR